MTSTESEIHRGIRSHVGDKLTGRRVGCVIPHITKPTIARFGLPRVQFGAQAGDTPGVSSIARQIAALVKTIQTDTQDAVAAMERSTQGVVEGAKLSDNAGTALGEIDRQRDQGEPVSIVLDDYLAASD